MLVHQRHYALVLRLDRREGLTISLHTFEGTETIQILIVGRDLIGGFTREGPVEPRPGVVGPCRTSVNLAVSAMTRFVAWLRARRGT